MEGVVTKWGRGGVKVKIFKLDNVLSRLYSRYIHINIMIQQMLKLYLSVLRVHILLHE